MEFDGGALAAGDIRQGLMRRRSALSRAVPVDLLAALRMSGRWGNRPAPGLLSGAIFHAPKNTHQITITPMNVRDTLEQWRNANDDARVAENVLSRMWQDYIDKRGPAPDMAQVEEVNELRRIAGEKLALAARLMRNTRP